jgi:hypothetical protein
MLERLTNMKTDKNFLMEDVYDYLMENGFNIGTNFRDEFPDSYIDSDKAVIYLKGSDKQYKLLIKEV